MDIFNNDSPFSSSGLTIDRDFTLYQYAEDRDSERSSRSKRTSIGPFRGSEPQMVQRVTTNLLSLGQDAAMQEAAFRIYTEESALNFRKGNIVTDGETSKSYKIIAIYSNSLGRDLSVVEVDD